GPHHIVEGVRWVLWAEVLDWSRRTYPRTKLNRKQATEYIRGTLGYPITDSTLQQNMYGAGPKLAFDKVGRDVEYTEEDCRGTPAAHPIPGDELRALRELQRNTTGRSSSRPSGADRSLPVRLIG